MKLIDFVLFSALILFTNGCVVTVVKEPPTQGHVFDYDTKKPIEGANVQLYKKPKTQTVSDPNGYFATKTPRKLGILFMGDIFIIKLTACHPDYSCEDFEAAISTSPNTVFKGDVYLKRKRQNSIK